ncbi:hypothetical protein GCM10010136_10880 [Limoniibacter endophyticus]|uniref:Uncharacterized protein n=2 Tax=Limoniibacter endophyticus TaxID=1565040 RepID=A0A8J3DFS9_9HYPH|nr:hypothetical protein GCM10010136_10880 [Limoniibacter endophyticus]
MAHAADSVSRQFRTGQMQSVDKVSLETMVCDRIKLMVRPGCPDLIVDMRTAGTFAELTQVQIDRDGKIVGDNYKYEIGGAMEKNMLHVMYKWPIFTDLVGRFAYQMPSERGKMLIFATAIWQNEPF